MDKDIHYELVDDGGSCALWMPILLDIGTVFKHEYGTYKVVEEIKGVVLCDRINKEGI